MQAANAVGFGDITLEDATYEIALAGLDDVSGQGDLDFFGLGASYAITGVGKRKTFIDATLLATTVTPDRVLHVLPSASLEISDLQVRGGLSKVDGGGGILNEGTLFMDRVIVYDNQNEGTYYIEGGGGLRNTGTATLTDCLIDSNVSLEAPGGGIYSSGTLNIGWGGTPYHYSTIARNIAGGSSGGGLIVRGPTTLEDTDIGNNEATNMGGGIYLDPPSLATPLEIRRSSISENKQMLAHGPSGSVWNTSAGGGGLAANDHTAATIEHSSILLNTTAGFGGGVYVRTPIGAVATTVLDMEFVTLYSNASSSTLGSAGGNIDFECTTATCSLGNSIVWGVCNSGVVTAAGSGNFEDSAKGTPTCGFGLFSPIGSVVVGKAGGNDTMVLQLSAGSPPVDAAIGTTCPVSPHFYDQRQFPRAASAPCDMGGFER